MEFLKIKNWRESNFQVLNISTNCQLTVEMERRYFHVITCSKYLLFVKQWKMYLANWSSQSEGEKKIEILKTKQRGSMCIYIYVCVYMEKMK